MASDRSLVDYICDRLSPAGEVKSKKMFGEYGLYLDGKFFACVCDDTLFVKVTDAGERLLPQLEKAPPYEGAKPSFVFDDIDNGELLCEFARVTCDALPAQKPKKRKAE